MPTEFPTALLTNAWPWTGRIITGLAVLFLVFDGVTKIIKVAPVIEASEKIGVSARTLPAIGVLLLACVVIHLIPRTSILGAILLTGFLGGAAAIHVRAGSGAFPVAFSVGFGVLVWAGLILRDPRVLPAVFLRQ